LRLLAASGAWAPRSGGRQSALGGGSQRVDMQPTRAGRRPARSVGSRARGQWLPGS